MSITAKNLETRRWKDTKVLDTRGGHTLIWGTFTDPGDKQEYRTMGIRWNGEKDDDNSQGYPRLFNNPVFMVIPNHLHSGIIADLVGRTMRTGVKTLLENNIFAVAEELAKEHYKQYIHINTLAFISRAIRRGKKKGYAPATYGLKIYWSLGDDGSCMIDGEKFHATDMKRYLDARTPMKSLHASYIFDEDEGEDDLDYDVLVDRAPLD